MMASQPISLDSYCRHRACTDRIVSECRLVDLVQKVTYRIVLWSSGRARKNLNDPPSRGSATRNTADAVSNCQQKPVVFPAEHPDGILVFVSS